MEGPPINPQVSAQEKGAEYIPTKEEILSQLSKFCEGGAVTKELRDERGIFLLRVEAPSKGGSETVDYTYQREGTFDKLSSAETKIFATYMEDGQITFADDKMHYNHQTREWKEV